MRKEPLPHPHPRRLSNREYFNAASPFRLFRTFIDSPIDVHWHEFFELAFVLSGEGEQILNGRPSPLVKGTLFLLTPADFHELYAEPQSPCLHYNLIFSEESMNEELRRLLVAQPRENLVCRVSDEDFGRVLADYERIETELLHDGKPGAHMIVKGTIERLLLEIIRQSPVKPGPARSSAFVWEAAIRHAVAYMQLHFRRPLTLDEVAGQANLSPNYFSRCFREFTGTTFQGYLQDLRLQFARSLLNASALPITEICFASGFNTLPHFERAFKKAFGQPPRLDRKQRKRS